GAARDAVRQRLALEQLHDQIVVADVVEGADVRMVQRRDRLRLALEARAQIGSMCELRRQDLDGDAAIEPGVAGAVDLAHPARAERPDDLVWTEARSWGELHRAARVPRQAVTIG